MANPSDPPVITPELAENVPTWRAAYSDRTSALMAAFSQLAYISFDPPPPGAVAGSANLDLLSARLAGGGFHLVDVFYHEDTQAFLAIHPTQFAVLAFRGTANLKDWGINLNVRLVPLPGREDVLVHEGFLEAFEGCRKDITEAVKTHVPPDLGLYITGHSLGGGLAQMASAILDADNIAACYTYGSPRVGRASFDRQVKCPHYRLVNHWDIVPGVPPPWFHRYRHTGDPRLLKPSTHEQEALRRQRYGLIGFGIDLYALATWVIRRSLSVIDDHMIWNYRTQLEAIARVRTGGAPTAGSAPPAP